VLWVFRANEQMNIDPSGFDGAHSEAHLNVRKYQVAIRQPSLTLGIADLLIEVRIVIIGDP
jgi:hypothetical protein